MTHFSKLLSYIFSLLVLQSCVSSGGPSYQKTEVIERIGGKDETPEWATGEVSMAEEKGQIVFVGLTSMGGDSRPESCMKAASEVGRTEIIRHIKDNISTSGQVSEDSAASDPGVESLTAYLAQGKLKGVIVQQRYWEKRLESDSEGKRVLRFFCAAKVGIDKSELKRQLQDAMGKQGNPEIRKKLVEAQNNFIESIGKSTSTSQSEE